MQLPYNCGKEARWWQELSVEKNPEAACAREYSEDPEMECQYRVKFCVTMDTPLRKKSTWTVYSMISADAKLCHSALAVWLAVMGRRRGRHSKLSHPASFARVHCAVIPKSVHTSTQYRGWFACWPPPKPMHRGLDLVSSVRTY